MNINNLRRKLKNPQVKGVVFDIGNTLIPYDEFAAAREIFDCSNLKDKTLGLIFETVFRSPVHKNFLTGLTRPGEYFKKVKENLDLDLSEEGFFRLYEKVFLSPNQEMIELMKEAKARGAKIGLLSDIDIVLYYFLQGKYSWVKEVDCRALSWEVGALKPDYRLFNKIEERLSLLPCEIFYIDDLRKNVEAARVGRRWLAEQYVSSS